MLAPKDLPLLIQTQPDLDAICILMARQQFIAVDTEFVRTNTYAPRLGLLQLTVAEHTACIDPLAGLDLQPFWTLLFDPQRTSIVHSAKQDLEAMWFAQGDFIHKLIDTQICAGLLGYPAQIGYAGLLAELLGIEIGKTETRTDWTRRPLTAQQLHYAAEDVIHLPEMHAILAARLRELGRYEWAEEDSLALCDSRLYQPEPAEAWQRIKSIPFLPPAQQARARALAGWRETRAVEADKPRQWIISDRALLQLASDNPANERALTHIDDLSPSVARKQGSQLLAVLQAANAEFEGGGLQLEQQPIDIQREKILSNRLSKIVRARAEQLGIAPEILASKRDINALIREPQSARVMQGWRREVIGMALSEALAD